MKPSLILLSALLPLSTARAGVASFFDADSDGWTAIGDTVAGIEYLPSGGNPGGCVRVKDDAVGGVWYFVAGPAYLGNQLASYGQLLRFDLRQVITGGSNQFASDDVILENGPLRLVYDVPVDPPVNGAWQSTSVLLSDAAAWKVGSAGGPPATQAQIQNVLANLTGFRIRGEYQSGEDTGSLDNVVFGIPASPAEASLEVKFQPVLKLQGTLGATYRIEYSATMESGEWDELKTVRLTSTELDIIDPVPPGTPRRFYRAVLLPP